MKKEKREKHTRPRTRHSYKKKINRHWRRRHSIERTPRLSNSMPCNELNFRNESNLFIPGWEERIHPKPLGLLFCPSWIRLPHAVCTFNSHIIWAGCGWLRLAIALCVTIVIACKRRASLANFTHFTFHILGQHESRGPKSIQKVDRRKLKRKCLSMILYFIIKMFLHSVSTNIL